MRPRQVWSALVLILSVCLSGSAGASVDQPNILLILTDDLGNNDIASWGDGEAPTPTLDQLSRESIRFRRHYTDSTCSPSRASLLTGQHAVSIGFQPNGLGLSSDLPNLPRSLKALGYRTAHVGKWHVGEALEYSEIQPGNLGFDYWLGFLNHFVLRGPDANGQIVQRQPTHIDPWLQENGQPPVQHKGYLDDLLTDKAIELIGKRDSQPWFINLWLYSPHTPYQPSPEFKAKYPDTPEGSYLAVLEQLDHNIGRLLAALKSRGVDDDTLVVFASDNGGVNQARDNNFPLQGKKATYQEGGVRSPLFVHWGGRYGSADIDSVTHITDLYPTLLALAGGRAPAGLMGRDLGPLLRGEPLVERPRLFWAADAGTLGMTFAAASFTEGRFFYRNPFGTISTQPITSAIGESRPKVERVPGFDAPQANRIIAEWERQARRVELQWHPSVAGKPAYLSGRDMQRAPVFAGYSLGLGLAAPAADGGRQVLVEQEAVWRLSLEADRRLRLRHGSVELYSAPVELGAVCNTLVASFDVQPAYTYPFVSAASSHVVLYLNGRTVLDSKQLLTRPSTAQPLSNPTFIGANSLGNEPYRGRIERPLLINKMLKPRQDGYALPNMLDELCKKEKQQ